MLGDDYSKEKWEEYAEWVSFHPQDEEKCPLCGDRWDVERGEDLCLCQFAKRERGVEVA